jgi:hypothetical protein
MAVEQLAISVNLSVASLKENGISWSRKVTFTFLRVMCRVKAMLAKRLPIGSYHERKIPRTERRGMSLSYFRSSVRIYCTETDIC